MGDVYRKASNIIIWLGPESDDSTLALNALSSLGSQVDRIDWYGTQNVIWKDSHNIASIPSNPTEFKAIMSLIRRQWFGRIWIRQEVNLATRATVECGCHRLAWDTFRNVIQAIYWASELVGHNYECTYEVARLQVPGSHYSIINLRDTLSRSHCHDSRDRIFAVLGLLAPNEHKLSITSNYTISVSEVYQDVALRYMKAFTNGTNLLRNYELVKYHFTGKLLSWVPEWRMDSLNDMPFGPSLAGSSLAGIVEEKESGVLGVGGVRCAIVDRVYYFPEGRTELDSTSTLRNFISELWKSIGLGEDDKISDFCDALNAGWFRERRNPERPDLDPFFPTCHIFASFLKSGGVVGHQDLKIWRRYLLGVRGSALKTRSFFVTHEGYFGLGPLSAQQGDLVSVVFGANLPMVLRPIQGQARHRLVGPSYIPQLKAGQAVWGTEWKNLQPVDENENGTAVFYGDTGRRYPIDPRCKKLSMYEVLVEETTPEESPWWCDVSIDELRSVGINAEIFELV